MLKRDKDGKFQFVFVNIEGDQETLQEALRQVGTVLNRGINPPVKTIIAVPASKIVDGNGNSEQTKDKQVYEVPDGRQESISTEESSPVQISKGKKTRKPPKTPPLLKELDLDSGEVSFRDFASQKDALTNFNKYLLIATWFKKYREVNEITTSHIYTCFQFMDWEAPDDMTATFRDMKRLHSYFEKGNKRGHWEITIVGLNVVDNKMRSKTAE